MNKKSRLFIIVVAVIISTFAVGFAFYADTVSTPLCTATDCSADAGGQPDGCGLMDATGCTELSADHTCPCGAESVSMADCSRSGEKGLQNESCQQANAQGMMDGMNMRSGGTCQRFGARGMMHADMPFGRHHR